MLVLLLQTSFLVEMCAGCDMQYRQQPVTEGFLGEPISPREPVQHLFTSRHYESDRLLCSF